MLGISEELLFLNVKKKTKALWLEKWKNNRNKLLDLKWFHSPVMILGIFFSYNIKENNELNFDKKIQKLKTKLDMWSSRDLTIFGRAMLIKTLGISQLIYSASNLDAPKGIVEIVRRKSFKFLWKNKKDKIKRSDIYQDLDNGGIRMIDFDMLLKTHLDPETVEDFRQYSPWARTTKFPISYHSWEQRLSYIFRNLAHSTLSLCMRATLTR